MLGIIIAGGIFGAVLGGQWRAWFNCPEKEGRYDVSDAINAFAFGVTAGFVTGNWNLAAVCVGAMWLGASPGCGDYIGAIGGWRREDLKENRFIDLFIKKLIAWPKLWGWAGMTIRGLFLGACLAVQFWMFGFGDIATALLINSMFMAPAYWLAIKWMEKRGYQAGDGWGLGEIFFNIALWSSLGA